MLHPNLQAPHSTKSEALLVTKQNNPDRNIIVKRRRQL